MKNGRRTSIDSMYEYEMSESRQSSYHSTYLKMVGATIALTFIGIIIFLQIEKFEKPLLKNFTEHSQMLDDMDQPMSPTELVSEDRPITNKPIYKYSNQQQGFHKQQWKTVANKMSSKRSELRRHLKSILILISELENSQS